MSTDQQTLDGEAVAQPVELADNRVQCHNCGEVFKKIGNHWSQGSTCSHPPLSEETHSIVTGLTMGDGCVQQNDSGYPWLGVKMITKPFLTWLDDKLGWFTTGVRLSRTAEESAHIMDQGGLHGSDFAADVGNYHDQYRLQSRRHPELQQYRDWYGGSGIQYPSDLAADSLAVKIWYVSDGGLHWGNRIPRIQFYSVNEQDTPETIIQILGNHGFDVSQSGGAFCLPTSQTENFLEWLGEAPPGFAYKWETDDYEEYQRKKEEMV